MMTANGILSSIQCSVTHPAGWKVVAYREPNPGECILTDDGRRIILAFLHKTPCFIMERVWPSPVWVPDGWWAFRDHHGTWYATDKEPIHKPEFLPALPWLLAPEAVLLVHQNTPQSSLWDDQNPEPQPIGTEYAIKFQVKRGPVKPPASHPNCPCVFLPLKSMKSWGICDCHVFDIQALPLPLFHPDFKWFDFTKTTTEPKAPFVKGQLVAFVGRHQPHHDLERGKVYRVSQTDRMGDVWWVRVDDNPAWFHPGEFMLNSAFEKREYDKKLQNKRQEFEKSIQAAFEKFCRANNIELKERPAVKFMNDSEFAKFIAPALDPIKPPPPLNNPAAVPIPAGTSPETVQAVTEECISQGGLSPKTKPPQTMREQIQDRTVAAVAHADSFGDKLRSDSKPQPSAVPNPDPDHPCPFKKGDWVMNAVYTLPGVMNPGDAFKVAGVNWNPGSMSWRLTLEGLAGEWRAGHFHRTTEPQPFQVGETVRCVGNNPLLFKGNRYKVKSCGWYKIDGVVGWYVQIDDGCGVCWCASDFKKSK